ncbi:Stigma-specific STIG1-like protein [Actinidia chinensis var. chinensis]|uniref:Stigma-specific STIG1-like protein n=1 Tax=Actinidia chinensis var. chinensis TaxID=1590841 RepID=A0A2R6PRF5_ACTCC|nr:Stigma-specific STIG1-like protein [Actinidia chinensis var. chinensis]
MKVVTIIFMVAITMAISITLLMENIGHEEEKSHLNHIDPPKDLTVLLEKKPMPTKKVSRFLAEQKKNSRSSNHCHKDHDVCDLEEGYNSTCCNNKCVDLHTDQNNCGVCKKICERTESCCTGKCVKLAYSESHCGACNNPCASGRRCIYGMCEYP